MSRRSPIDLPIALEPRTGSVQDALYSALRDAMLSGRLSAGTRMPSSRDLGRQLAVARGTVVASYTQLASEGYLVSRTGSGTFVADQLPDGHFRASRNPPPTAAQRERTNTTTQHWSHWAAALDSSPFPIGKQRNPRPFRAHLPAVDEFPLEIWTRLLTQRVKRDDSLWLSTTEVRGYRPLREHLAEHLRVARGVNCHEEQIVIVPSTQQVLDLLGRLLLDPGDAVWLEDPGYVGARAVFAALGAQCVSVPVDEQGIDVARGIERAAHARLAYVTPGNQAPLGATCSPARRAALLSWARTHGALVIEDDYDSEYRYGGRPIPALQGLDRANVVIHTGTFSKTLLPALRLAYVVVPERLLERFLAAKSLVDRYTPMLMQAVLADFIAAGHFGRHLRRMREIYAERRGALLTALSQLLGDSVRVLGADAGIDLPLLLPAGSNEDAVCAALQEHGVDALGIATHTYRERVAPGLILGFAAFSPARLRKSAEILARVLERQAR